MKFLNKSDIPLVLWWSIIAIVVVLALIACNAEAATSTEFNNTNWNLTSGTMLEHGDGNLRAPPSVWEDIAAFWSPGTDVGSGTVLKDLSGNGNDGTIHGATWNMTSGMLEYNGTSDYVNCGNDSSLNITNTITLFIDVTFSELPSNQTTNYPGIISKNIEIYSFGAIKSSGLIRFRLNTGFGNKDITFDESNILAGTSYNLSGTYDGTTQTFYLDGSSIGTPITYSSTITPNSDPFGIGYFPGAGNYFLGSVGRTAIYNISLTNDQINETNAGYHNTTSYMETDSPIDAGTGYVNMYVWFNGTDAGGNTTIELQVKKNDTATWETAIADVTMNTNLTIPVGVQYQNASFRWYENTSYQPETDVIESVTFISAIPPPRISLISFYPTPLNTNYTGVTTISYMVESYHPLNLSSLAFLYGLNYTITGDMHNYIATPPNSISHEGIYLAPNRNVTPYLSWEFNDTITEGNVWQWGGGDNNSWWISKNPVNATHTYINATGVTQHILPSSFYIQKLAIYNAPKTGFEINRQQGLIFKMWNVEEIRNRGHNYFANLYFDTSWESTLPTHPVEVGFCNYSYDPAVDDIDTCPDCIKFGEWDGNRWVNHSWVPGPNASYALPFVVNGSQYTEPIPTDINYIWLRSNTISSKSFVLNATNYDPGITNISYNQTNTMWTYNELNGVTTPVAYTPSFFTTFVRDYEELLHHLYIADDTGTWAHSEIFNETIGLSSVPVLPVSFEHFNVTCQGNYIEDTLMDATYDDGSILVNIHCPADPDGGTVSHNLTLHYANNQTLVAVINDTFTTSGDEYVDINFTTTPYYSSSVFYTLRCVSADDENDVATKWLISDFTLDADGNQGWVVDDRVMYWGMNNIPTLYTVINNNSLISYNAGTNNYTMHVPFFKSKSNDSFGFNETVHLESLNNEDVAYFRHSGETIFDNATIHAWNTTTDTAAPITDEYRGYVYSHFHVCGNITNSDFSHSGSDFYRQEGLNFIDNPHEYLIYNTTFSHNVEGPIMEYCSNMNISQCTITDNVNTGVGIYFTDDIVVSNNVLNSNGGRGITMYEANNNIISFNDITNSGIHGVHYWSNSINNTCTGNDISGSALYDYYLSSSSLGNYIIDPASTTDRIRVTSTSSVNIENTDNAVFSEDSLNTSYAYLTNFSMYVSGTSQTFDITQRDMTVLPSEYNLSIKNLEWNNAVKFNAASDIGVNQTWFNITNEHWDNKNITLFIDDTKYTTILADANGTIAYNYSVVLGDKLFEFRFVIPPPSIPLSIFIMWSVIMFVGAAIGFMTTGVYGITSSLLTATIAYMNSKSIINGSVVQYFAGVSTGDTIVTGSRSIESLPMSYIYLFIAIVMVIVFILHVKNEIIYQLEPDMDGEFFDE